MTNLPQLGLVRFRMVQTVMDAVDMPARCLDFREHHTFECFQEFRLKVALGDPGLIGNNGHSQPEIVQNPDGHRDAREKLELRAREGRIDHARVFVVDQRVDYAIAIEQDGFHREKRE